MAECGVLIQIDQKTEVRVKQIKNAFGGPRGPRGPRGRGYFRKTQKTPYYRIIHFKKLRLFLNK